MISEEQLLKYKEIYKKHSNKNISDEEALKQATTLLRLIKIIYKPMTQEEYDQLQKRRAETK
jgi:hypothetical protein